MTRVVRCISRLPSGCPDPNAKGLVASGTIRINRGSLRAMVVVFDTPRNLNRFWKATMGSSLGDSARGAVNALGCTRENVTTGRVVYEVDRRYFCLVGLVRGYLGTEVITHESVHIAYAFAKRRSRNEWDEYAEESHEEILAYPTGRAAAELVRWLRRKKLIE